MDWFDNTHGVAHGCRHLEVAMETGAVVVFA